MNFKSISLGALTFLVAVFATHKLIFAKKPQPKVEPQVRTPSPLAPAIEGMRVEAGIDATLGKPKTVEDRTKKTMEYKLTVPPLGTRYDFRVQMISEKRGNAVSDETWILADNSGGKLRWIVNNSETAESSLNPFLPLLESSSLIGREDLSRTMTGDDMTIFPLATGKSMTVTITNKGRGRLVSYVYKCVVAAFSTAKSKVGEYDVAEINCSADGENIKYTSKYIFSPVIGTSLYFERLSSKGDGKHFTLRRELIGTSFRER